MTTQPTALQSLDDEELPFDPRRLALGLLARWRWIAGAGLALGVTLAAAGWLAGEQRYEARVGLVKRRSHNEILLDRNVVIGREDYSMSTVAGSVKTARVLTGVRDETGYPGSLAQLSRSISVDNPRNTELLLIRVQDPDPARAAEIARSILGHFQADHQVRALANAREAIRVLSQRRETVTERVRGLEQERLALLAENGFSDVEDERSALLEQRNFVEQERILARERLGRGRRAGQELSARLGDEPDMVLFSSTEDLPLQRDLARAEVELAGILQRYTEEHPLAVGLREQVTELRQRIEAGQDHALRRVTQQLNPLKGRLELEVVSAGVETEVAGARLAALELLGREVRDRLDLLRDVERRLSQLDREMREAHELLLAYRNGIEGAEILLAGQAPTFEVVEEPLVPGQPLPSKRNLHAVAGLAGGVLVALFLGLGLELRDTRVRAAEELRALGLETVHILPVPSQEAGGSYALAAQVLFSPGDADRPPVFAGLTDDPLPEELARAFAAVGQPEPLPARRMAEAPVPDGWQERSRLLVIPAGQVRRDTIERYLRRARRLGVAPTAALFVSSVEGASFDTLA
jgi:uncharacterized protein involved in exopolysaccharide biosynthesis